MKNDRGMLSPQAAAGLLMGEKHLTFIGAERFQEHRGFLSDMVALMPECLLFRTQAEYQ